MFRDREQDDWEAAGDLVRFNTRFAPGTPDWEQAQTAVLAGILDGREQAAWERQDEQDRDLKALTRLRAECDRLRAALAAVASGQVGRTCDLRDQSAPRQGPDWYAYDDAGQCLVGLTSLDAALKVIGLGTGEGR